MCVQYIYILVTMYTHTAHANIILEDSVLYIYIYITVRKKKT